ncbi:MAG: SUMF1/EgtB/PvdO family nonheme iron enzyme [Gammaproteobacteria bacterium]|nr:SUMF1/EgtB/PvdO family nonheme iron enzyme [Gammaproteobacteria bacterium]
MMATRATPKHCRPGACTGVASDACYPLSEGHGGPNSMRHISAAKALLSLVLATALIAELAYAATAEPGSDATSNATGIEFDRLVAEFELRIEQRELRRAVEAFAEMQRVASGSIPHELWYQHAVACHEAGLLDAALESANQYVLVAGREGEHYRQALRLSVLIRDRLEEAERERQAAERERAQELAFLEALELKARTQQKQAVDLPQDLMKGGGAAPSMVRLPEGRVCREPREGGNCLMTDVPAFAISKHAVTVEEFRRFVRATRYRTTSENRRTGCYESREVVLWPGDEGYERSQREFYRRTWKTVSAEQTDRHPVVCVSFADANRYAAWLSDQTGRRYTVPGQVQWQWAFIAGTTIGHLELHPSKYWRAFHDWGHQKPQYWRCLDRAEDVGSYRLKGPVGSSCPPNPVGILFEGGLWEWNGDEGWNHGPGPQTRRIRVDLGFRVARNS